MIPRNLVRDATLQILRMSPEPAVVRDLVDAVYYLTGDDRVGYSNVMAALRALAVDALAEKVSDGVWRAAPVAGSATTNSQVGAVYKAVPR